LNLTSQILEIVEKIGDYTHLSKLDSLHLEENNIFDENDCAYVLSEIIWDKKAEPCICSNIIERLVNKYKFNVNGFNNHGQTLVSYASHLFLFSKTESVNVVITLLQLGANPCKKDKLLPGFDPKNSESIYKRLCFISSGNLRVAVISTNPYGVVGYVCAANADFCERGKELLKYINIIYKP